MVPHRVHPDQHTPCIWFSNTCYFEVCISEALETVTDIPVRQASQNRDSRPTEYFPNRQLHMIPERVEPDELIGWINVSCMAKVCTQLVSKSDASKQDVRVNYAG